MTIRDATAADAFTMAPNVRSEDGMECVRSADIGPLDAMLRGLAYARACKTVELWGRPIAMFGVNDGHTPDVGVIWMLTTPDLPRLGKTLMRVAGDWLDWLGRGYAVTGNYVDACNELHVRWLGRMGYEFTELVQDFGPYHSPFLRFRRRAHV